MKKLSPKQLEMMRLLHEGHQPVQAGVSTVHVNGKRVCNYDTMDSLVKRGLAEKVTRYQWRITSAGTDYMDALSRAASPVGEENDAAPRPSEV